MCSATASATAFIFIFEPMKDFAAIDFETANEQRTSVCSVGVVVVRGGVIADRFYSLIRPEPEYYSYWNTRVHGLALEDTADAPVFPHVWEKVAPLIEGLPLVAHNSPFDEGCLRAVFQVYRMDYPEYVFPAWITRSMFFIVPAGLPAVFSGRSYRIISSRPLQPAAATISRATIMPLPTPRPAPPLPLGFYRFTILWSTKL